MVTAQAGAEDLEAAAREAAAGSTAWLDRLRTAQLAKAYLEGRRRIAPHLVGALAKRERPNSVRLGSVALRALREQLGPARAEQVPEQELNCSTVSGVNAKT